MKLAIGLISFFFYSITFATPATCEVSTVILKLNSDHSQECAALKIEGTYQLKLCSNNQGTLTGEDRSARFLFVDSASWIARQDLLDYTNNISSTEIFRMDHQISKFKTSKFQTTIKGKVLKQFDCTGTIQTGK
jgi:hypothetical protein